MTRSEQNWSSVSARLAGAVGLFILLVTPVATWAQTLTTLHSFSGGGDGAYSEPGLTRDQAGNFYGTASAGGILTGNCPAGLGCGVVFRMTKHGSSWVLLPIYAFQGGSDGQEPLAEVIFGPDGTLYGSTNYGGQGTCDGVRPGCGVVFNLRPAASACKNALCPWTETILYRFSGGADGGEPFSGTLAFDRAGNLYGSTVLGGSFGGDCAAFGCGVIYKLAPSHGSWSESVVYTFLGDEDGANPQGPVIPDNSGNLYGITATGGTSICEVFYQCGTVFQLSPSGSGYAKTILYAFQGASDGYFPFAGLTFDSSGNLYGSTSSGGQGGGGTVFEMSHSSGSWVFSVLYGLPGAYQGGPRGALALDQRGNLYGTTLGAGTYGLGTVFKLTPNNGSWLYTDLHDFYGGTDGGYPYDTPVVDADGNVYGSANSYGQFSFYGTVWEITP